jgi:hypothetical protein
MLEYFNLSQKDLLDIYISLSNNRFSSINCPLGYAEDWNYKINLRTLNGKCNSKMYLTISKSNEEGKAEHVKDIKLPETQLDLLARPVKDWCESVYNANLDIRYSERYYKNFEKVISEGLIKCQKQIAKDIEKK